MDLKLEEGLARIGEATSKCLVLLEEMRQAADALVQHLQMAFSESGGKIHKLPMGYTFQYWSRNEYKLECLRVGGKTDCLSLTSFRRMPSDLLQFANDVNEGLLEAVLAQIEEMTTPLESALERFATHFPVPTT